jgi:hypothetical protein
MPRFRITKYVEAKSVKEALRKEATAEIEEVVKDELEAKETPNTHAIGFHIPPDALDIESYDPSP